MKCSICLSTYDRPKHLRQVLESIFRQRPPFDFEVCVADDCSPTREPTDVCARFPVKYQRIEREPGYRNPARGRNVAYRLATGDVIIAQSDDVIHVTENCIERLVSNLKPAGEFLIATVVNVGEDLKPSSFPIPVFTGLACQRPFFFLGSLWRRDLYAIGGNDPDFVHPGFDDNWFADCLMEGLHLKPRYMDDILGYHIDHPRPDDLHVVAEYARAVYLGKKKDAQRSKVWCSKGGPW